MRKILFLMYFLYSVGCSAGMVNKMLIGNVESDTITTEVDSASSTASQNESKVKKDTIVEIVNVQEYDFIIPVQRFFQKKGEDKHLYGEVDGDKNHGGMNLEILGTNFKKANANLDSIVVAFSRGTTSLLIYLDLGTWKKSNKDTLAIYFPMEKKRNPDFDNLFCLKLVLCKAEIAELENEIETVPTPIVGEDGRTDNDWFTDVNEYVYKWFPIILLVLFLLLFSYYMRQNSIIKTLGRLKKENESAKEEFGGQLSQIELIMRNQRNTTSSNNYSKNVALNEIKSRMEKLEKSVELLKVGNIIVDKEEKVNLDNVPNHEMSESEIIFDTTDVEYSNGQFLVKDNPNYRLFRIYFKDKMFFYSLADEKNSDFRHQILDILNVIAGAVEVVNSVTSASEVRVSRPGELFKVDDTTFRIVKKMQVELV